MGLFFEARFWFTTALTIATIVAILRRKPGRGWALLLGSVSIQLIASIGLKLINTIGPAFPGSAGNITAMSLMCLFSVGDVLLLLYILAEGPARGPAKTEFGELPGPDSPYE
jgi:hypothetical protein